MEFHTKRTMPPIAIRVSVPTLLLVELIVPMLAQSSIFASGYTDESAIPAAP